MRSLKVRVVPNSRKEEVAREGGALKVKVRAPATDGKANDAVVKAVSKFLGCGKNEIRIVRGAKSRNKTLEVP